MGSIIHVGGEWLRFKERKIMIKVEDFNSFMFSLMHHAGSCYHTMEIEKFIKDNGCDIKVFKELSDYMNEKSKDSIELTKLKREIEKREIQKIKESMPEKDVAEWIYLNFVKAKK